MSTGWVLYVCLMGVAAGAVAHAAEVVLRRMRRQARAVWLAAAVVSTVVAVAPLAPTGAVANSPAGLTPAESDGSSRALGGPGRGREPGRAMGADLRASVPGGAAAWLALSLAVAMALAGAGARVRSGLRGSRVHRVAGYPVIVTRAFGPAAIGVVRGRIAVPTRVVHELDGGSLLWVVEHEAEHLRGQDVRLLAVCGLLLVAAPWSLPLWWHASRLARAIELDCDLRLLRRGVEPRKYGQLLLTVAHQCRGAALVPALARRGVLRSRMEQITGQAPSLVRVAAAVTLSWVAVAGVVACEPPPVLGLDAGTAEWRDRGPLLEAGIADADAFRRAIASLARSRATEGAEGVVALSLRIDAEGRVEGVRIDATSGPAITAEALDLATDIARHTRLAMPENAGAGWVPLWVAFLDRVVEAHLVRPSAYREAGLARDEGALVRHMELFRRLHGSGRARISRAMAAADRHPADSVSHARGPSVRPLFERVGR